MEKNQSTATNNEVKRLFEKYQEFSNSKVIIRKSEFKKYEVLFRKPGNTENINEDELMDLSKEFLLRINPYKPIHILDDNSDEVLLTLPPIFIPVKEIKSEYDNAFKKEQATLLKSNIPKYTTEAMKNMVTLIASSQGKNISEYKDRVREYKKITNKLRDDFNELKSQNLKEESEENDKKLSVDLKEESEDSLKSNTSTNDFFDSFHEE